MTDTPSSSPGPASDVDVALVAIRYLHTKGQVAQADYAIGGLYAMHLINCEDYIAALRATVDAQAAALQRSTDGLKTVCQIARDGWWLPHYDRARDYTYVEYEGYREITETIAAFFAHEYTVALAAASAEADTPTGGSE